MRNFLNYLLVLLFKDWSHMHWATLSWYWLDSCLFSVLLAVGGVCPVCTLISDTLFFISSFVWSLLFFSCFSLPLDYIMSQNLTWCIYFCDSFWKLLCPVLISLSLSPDSKSDFVVCSFIYPALCSGWTALPATHPGSLRICRWKTHRHTH